MWAVREHQYQVMIDSYNPIRTLVSGLVRKERPGTVYQSAKRPSVEKYTPCSPQ